MKTNVSAPLNGALALLAALALPASAARLAYEGFEYTEANGTVLSALATPGGTGWDGNYGSNLTNTTTSVNLQTGLSYTGFTSAPSSKAMRFGSSNTVYRPWSGTYAAPDTVADGTYWYSFIYRPTAGSRGGTLCAFGKPSDPQNGFGMRMDRGSDVGGNAIDIRFQAWGNNGGGGTLTIANGYDKNYFILGKAVFNAAGNSTNTLWIYSDPAALPTTEPTTGGIVHTIAFNAPPSVAGEALGTGSFRTVMSGRCFSTGGIIIDYDEFRVGNTFAEVFPSVGSVPEFSLNPATAIENQTLTFAWTNLPAASNPTLNGSPVTIDGSGNGGTTLPAPATNTTYTLAWTGAGSPLTQNFTAIAPFFTLSPSTGYLGDTTTLNWRVPVSTLPGITAVTLTPVPGGVPVDLGGFTNATTGIGSTTLPAPTATTVYTLSYTFNGNPFSLPTQTFTLLPSFFTVAPPQPITDYTDLKITWRIPPEWDDNTTAPNTVFLRYGSPADFAASTYTESELTAKTAPLTGAGSNVKPDNTTDPEIVPGAGQTEYRLVFNVGNVEQVLSANVTLRPKIISIDDVVNNKKPVEIDDYPLLDGVFAYSDRGHAWANIPTILQGAQFIKLANDDKVTAVSDPPVDPPPHFNITFSAVQNSTFFLLLDNRIGDGNGTNPPTLGNGVMDWVLISGFVDTGLDIGLDESAATQPGVDQTYSVFFKQVNLGDSFTFQEQNDGGARNMYGIAAVSPQIVPVSFAASPATINEGQSTTLQWTVPVGATASIDQNIGPVSVDGVGVGSTIVFPTTTTTYKLTYVLGANPPVELAPVTVTVNATTSPFALWMFTNFPAITAPNNAPDVDADGDGVSNFGEFAFSGNPGSGSDDGLTRSAIDNISGTNHLTLTFACRTGATFTGAGPVTASMDGVNYTVRATTDLSAFTVGVNEITPAINTGLPDPAPTGYSYRTFRVAAAQSANAKAFMQAIAAPTPTP